MSIPTLADVTAAWHALPSETRDRIGIAVIDMTLAEFIHGDLYVANGQPQDRPVFDDAIREAAADRAHRRLNELPRIIELALPDLFGPDGENPAWSENAGPVPTPAALAAVAREAAEEADHNRRLHGLRIRLGRKGMKLWRENSGYVVTDRGSGIPKTDTLSLDGIEAWLALNPEAQ